MVRRDVFIQRYVEQNNQKMINSEVIELEKFVDTQLLDINNLINYINQNGLSGTAGVLVTQDVTAAIVNNSIHRTPSVLDNGAGRTADKIYAFWSNGLTDASGNNVSGTPYYDLNIDTPITGELRVTLPENTNKNAAYLLLQKYLGPVVSDSSLITQNQIDTMGFWGRQPTLGSSGNLGATLDPDAVRLEYDSSQDRLVMIFTL